MTNAAIDRSYGSDQLVERLGNIILAHRRVGDDFANDRAALLANLRTLLSALPPAIAEVEQAMRDAA